ncbi:sulfatase-like hydrolase/transferase [Stieleria neptunia]
MILIGWSCLPVDAGERPNLVFILADDLGFNQIGAYGDTPIKTPNLDRLAETGIRFTQAYAGNTVCSPSRVSLFTGRDGRLRSKRDASITPPGPSPTCCQPSPNWRACRLHPCRESKPTARPFVLA